MSEAQPNPEGPDTNDPKVPPPVETHDPTEDLEFDDPSVAIDPPETQGGGY